MSAISGEGNLNPPSELDEVVGDDK